MKLGYLFPSYIGWNGEEPEVTGGAETHFLALGRALARNMPVTCISFARSEAVVEKGLLRIVFLRAPIRAGLVNARANPLTRRVFDVLREVDVVQCQGVGHDLSLATTIWGRVHDKPTVVKGDGWSGATIARILDPRHFCDAIAAQSRLEQAQYPQKSYLCYDGVDTEFFHPELSTDRRGAVFVGRAIPSKGIEHLIFASSLGDFPATVIGPFPESDYTAFLCRIAASRPNVRLLGRVNKTTLREELQRASVFVFPFVHYDFQGRYVKDPELFGLACAEAMACGTPIITSRNGAPAELVEQFSCGITVNEGRPAEIAEAVCRLSNDPELWKRLSENALRAANRVLAWDRVAERYLRMYKQIAERTSSASRRWGGYS